MALHALGGRLAACALRPALLCACAGNTIGGTLPMRSSPQAVQMDGWGAPWAWPNLKYLNMSGNLLRCALTAVDLA